MQLRFPLINVQIRANHTWVLSYECKWTLSVKPKAWVAPAIACKTFQTFLYSSSTFYTALLYLSAFYLLGCVITEFLAGFLHFFPSASLLLKRRSSELCVLISTGPDNIKVETLFLQTHFCLWKRVIRWQKTLCIEREREKCLKLVTTYRLLSFFCINMASSSFNKYYTALLHKSVPFVERICSSSHSSHHVGRFSWNQNVASCAMQFQFTAATQKDIVAAANISTKIKQFLLYIFSSAQYRSLVLYSTCDNIVPRVPKYLHREKAERNVMRSADLCMYTDFWVPRPLCTPWLSIKSRLLF